jgi:hypothetical protein
MKEAKSGGAAIFVQAMPDDLKPIGPLERHGEMGMLFETTAQLSEDELLLYGRVLDCSTEPGRRQMHGHKNWAGPVLGCSCTQPVSWPGVLPGE